jgi:hypothetical protein
MLQGLCATLEQRANQKDQIKKMSAGTQIVIKHL